MKVERKIYVDFMKCCALMGVFCVHFIGVWGGVAKHSYKITLENFSTNFLFYFFLLCANFFYGYGNIIKQ